MHRLRRPPVRRGTAEQIGATSIGRNYLPRCNGSEGGTNALGESADGIVGMNLGKVAIRQLKIDSGSCSDEEGSVTRREKVLDGAGI